MKRKKSQPKKNITISESNAAYLFMMAIAHLAFMKLKTPKDGKKKQTPPPAKLTGRIQANRQQVLDKPKRKK